MARPRLLSVCALLLSGSAVVSLVGCEITVEPAFDGVTLQIVDTYRLADGTEVKKNASQDGVTKTVLTDLGPTGKSFPGKLAADGSKLEFEGVPTGPYWILSESPRDTDPAFPAPPVKQYIRIGAARTVDSGALIAGRPEVSESTKETITSVVVPSMEVPWQQYTEDVDGNVVQQNQDYVEVYAFNADAWSSPYPTETDPNLPTDQATSLAGWTFDWNLVTNAMNRAGSIVPLLDAAAGDDPILTHVVSTNIEDPAASPSDPWAYWTLDVAADAGAIGAVTMADGQPAKLEATLTSGASKSFDLDLRGTAFAAEFTANGPSIVSTAYMSFSNAREPGAPLPIYGNSPTLFYGATYGFEEQVNPTCFPDDMGMCDATACPSGCDDAVVFRFPGDLKRAITFTDPYEKHGQELFGATLSVTTYATHPASMKRVRLRSYLSSSAPAADASGKAWEPHLGFPRTVTIGGRPAPVDATTTATGTTLDVAWAAPSVGKPTSYVVRVTEWADSVSDPMATSSSGVVLATFRTSETSVTIPDGILQSGHYYSLSVRADDWFDETKPSLYLSSTLASAEISTGLITP